MKNLKIVTIAFLCIIAFSCKKENTIQSTNKKYNTGLDVSDSDKIRLLPIADTSEFFRLRLQQFESKFWLDMPPIEEQNPEGSCTSFSVAYACMSYYFNKKYNKNYELGNKGLFSPRFMHNNIKDPSKPCDTAGSSYIDAFKYLKNYGVCTWDKMPYLPKDCTSKGDTKQKENASYFKIEVATSIINLSKDYFKYLIYETKSPIMIGVVLDEGFFQLKDKGDSTIWKENIGKTDVNHAMIITGWNDKIGGGAWKVMNSWAADWGDYGYVWITYDHLLRVLVKDVVPEFRNFAFTMIPNIDTVGIKPHINTLEADLITKNSARLNSHMLSTGADEISERGFAYGKTLNDLVTISVSQLTTPFFSTNITGLTPDTYYYVLSYAKNVYGVTWDTLATRFKTLPSVPTNDTIKYCFTDNTTPQQCYSCSGGDGSGNACITKTWFTSGLNYYIDVYYFNGIPISGLVSSSGTGSGSLIITPPYVCPTGGPGTVTGDVCQDPRPCGFNSGNPNNNGNVTFTGNNFSSADGSITGNINGNTVTINLNGINVVMIRC
ncbi:MAG TPA: C1 family peptidase [Chitinophagales bacterium]|nr:C1 family peptidase [Chitinophagales bacterium]